MCVKIDLHRNDYIINIISTARSISMKNIPIILKLNTYLYIHLLIYTSYMIYHRLNRNKE